MVPISRPTITLSSIPRRRRPGDAAGGRRSRADLGRRRGAGHRAHGVGVGRGLHARADPRGVWDRLDRPGRHHRDRRRPDDRHRRRLRQSGPGQQHRPNFATSDLHQFDLAFGLPDPPSFQKLDENGGTNYPAADTQGWSLEEALDVEWADAIAPQANIILLERLAPRRGPDLDGGEHGADLPGVSVVSINYGRSEDSSDTALSTVFTTPAGNQGVTFFRTGPGDSGAQGGFPAYHPTWWPWAAPP